MLLTRARIVARLGSGCGGGDRTFRWPKTGNERFVGQMFAAPMKYLFKARSLT
jgi:hypothetical protein